MKILIIDDDRIYLSALEMRYEKLPNVTICQCNSTKSALEAITKHQPEAVLLDNSLSGSGSSNGLEVARSLRSNPETVGINLYSISAALTRQDENAYRELGVEIVGKSPERIFPMIDQLAS